MEWNALVPELVVTDYARSKAFYVDVFGFTLRFERAENKFGYFDLGGAQVMLLEGADRPIYQMHRSGPNGKGLHFQVEVPSLSEMLERLSAASIPYLYRFCEYIGERSTWSAQTHMPR
jgi:catechol 2,3-dioxygenase-like lactoylglutathione lyase family enzyme